MELDRRFRHGLKVVLRRRCGDPDEAEDLVQETLLLVLEKIRRNKIDNPERLAGFIHGTARHLWLNQRRKTARLTGLEEAANDGQTRMTEPRSDHLEDLLRREESRLVRELLSDLEPPRDRQILIRFYLSQQSKTEICSALGIEPDHFRRVLYRARERLRDQWKRLQKRGRLEREAGVR